MSATIPLEEVKTLVAQGANIEYRDPQDRTALMNAANIGSLELVKYLVEKGANINSNDEKGDTALDIALDAVNETAPNDWGHKEVVKYLNEIENKKS